MARFIGIDLAWSAKNPTGLAALDYDPNTHSAALMALPAAPVRTDTGIVSFVQSVAADAPTVIVAIDAPLAVPNVAGQREAESSLNAAFRRFEAGAHPANRRLLGSYNGGEVRGETLVAGLRELGIKHDPVLMPQRATRQAFEVYPHPAMIVLFGLTRTLKYKRPGAGRLDAFRSYQRHLKALAGAEPALHLASAPDLLADSQTAQHGFARKAYEDQLDAIFCAYIGLYYWYWGLARCHIFADRSNDYAQGYILTPIDERTRPKTNLR